MESTSKKMNLSPLAAKVLSARGFSSVEEAASFLDTSMARLHDPYLLDGMERAVSRIKQAIENKEKILIFGDYDADGVSSTTLMVLLLKEAGAVFGWYIPNRFTEGYGPNIPAVEQAAADGASLMITVDTGISAKEEVAAANALGMDVIITDHHEPPPELPEAFAIINPKKPGCSYPFKELAGVGVAFKVAHALLGELPGALFRSGNTWYNK
ncbi:DHH family phosphoesterase [Sinobaca sp. H24]|uniref:single-stranded-DNA-specific exonuclease RecJ n=1 Tax=Sinobaca sp. H24 TaxID=2923376 RepID=UPI0020799760|nr:DHH family phosphoesterase [Sinobaca sp. H24]